jgi:glycosyltransferase involved in cell wall biosynthesis
MSSSNSKEYPRITIITPSYNQGRFIEETIQSVLSQGYPNLEYLIIDGGSTDNTVEVIKKYEAQITHWVSEPDRGQTHAINKGLAIATGDIIAYLNSDDYYLPGALHKVADYFQNHPQTSLCHGHCVYVDEQGNRIGEQIADISRFDEIIDLWGVWWKKRQFVQPEVFWSRQITEQIGAFNESLYYVMDYEYWSRILRVGGRVGKVDAETTCFRFTATQKSNQSARVAEELLRVVQPWLWDQSTPIAWQKKLALQAKWLYQAQFLTQIERSVQAQEHQWLRWLKSIGIILHYPKILLDPYLYRRITKSLTP